MSIKSAPEYIEGNVARDIMISIFDGHTVKGVKSQDGKFRTPHQATAGLYEALFLTKDNYYPKVLVIRAGEKTKALKIEHLKKMKDPKKGILAGVVYKPVSGGKLSEHSGIAELFKGEKINITKDGKAYSATTDEKGFFLIELQEGAYDVMSGAGRASTVTIEPGKTAIKNIQKGIILY